MTNKPKVNLDDRGTPDVGLPDPERAAALIACPPRDRSASKSKVSYACYSKEIEKQTLYFFQDPSSAPLQLTKPKSASAPFKEDQLKTPCWNPYLMKTTSAAATGPLLNPLSLGGTSLLSPISSYDSLRQFSNSIYSSATAPLALNSAFGATSKDKHSSVTSRRNPSPELNVIDDPPSPKQKSSSKREEDQSMDVDEDLHIDVEEDSDHEPMEDDTPKTTTTTTTNGNHVTESHNDFDDEDDEDESHHESSDASSMSPDKLAEAMKRGRGRGGRGKTPTRGRGRGAGRKRGRRRKTPRFTIDPEDHSGRKNEEKIHPNSFGVNSFSDSSDYEDNLYMGSEASKFLSADEASSGGRNGRRSRLSDRSSSDAAPASGDIYEFEEPTTATISTTSSNGSLSYSLSSSRDTPVTSLAESCQKDKLSKFSSEGGEEVGGERDVNENLENSA